MSESSRVKCGLHGETPATFACRHLSEGVACGYHADTEDPSQPWPDAWCDLCDAALQAQGGEWTATAEDAADIQVLCTHCYDAARARNRAAPPQTRGAIAQLTAQELDALLHHATHEMQAIQAASQQRWRWNAMARWDFDAKARTLTFSDDALPTVIADVRLIGSYATTSETFQWAWATYEEGAPQARDIARLRVFGEVRGIAKLTTPHWKCGEAESWEMASLAGYVLGTETGAKTKTEALYRAPFGQQHWFMRLSNLRHPSDTPAATGA